MEPKVTRHYHRRTADQWKVIVENFNLAGQSGVVYCRENDIAYASFCKWRQRFSSQLGLPELSHDNSTPAFIDLSLLPQKNLTDASSPGWHIVLKLGNDVELFLSQCDASS